MLYAVRVAAAGHLHQAHAQLRGRHEGPEVARLQPGHRHASPNWSARSRSPCRRRNCRRPWPPASSIRTCRSGSTGFDTKTYEHIKNWYDTQAWLPKNAVIVNKKAFDALDTPTQAAVTKAAAEAETRGWKLSQDKERVVQEGARPTA